MIAYTEEEFDKAPNKLNGWQLFSMAAILNPLSCTPYELHGAYFWVDVNGIKLLVTQGHLKLEEIFFLHQFRESEAAD